MCGGGKMRTAIHGSRNQSVKLGSDYGTLLNIIAGTGPRESFELGRLPLGVHISAPFPRQLARDLQGRRGGEAKKLRRKPDERAQSRRRGRRQKMERIPKTKTEFTGTPGVRRLTSPVTLWNGSLHTVQRYRELRGACWREGDEKQRLGGQ